MDTQPIFDLAKKKGITDLQIYISSSKSISISLYESKIDQYELNESFNILAKGIYKGKMAKVSTEKIDRNTPKFIVDSIIKNAKVITSKDEVFIYEGSKEYGEVNTYNPELEKISMEDKIAKLYEIDKLVRKENNIKDVASVFYSEETSELQIVNSKGLKLDRKSNYFQAGLEVIKELNGMSEAGFYWKLENDFSKLDSSLIVKKAIEDVDSKLGGKPCKTGTYDIVLDSNTSSAFLSVVLGGLSYERISKNRSFLKDKLNEKVFGENITVIEDPLNKESLSSKSFDSEGVATKYKTLIEKGVVKTYVYNLKNARKMNVEPTGNGSDERFTNATLLGENNSPKDLYKLVGNGLYITDLDGMHSGLDPISGNFSLKAGGRLIENGELTSAVKLITISGNVYKMFNNVLALGNDFEEVKHNDIKAPSVIFKDIAVSGE